jgi:hypothetical protein
MSYRFCDGDDGGGNPKEKERLPKYPMKYYTYALAVPKRESAATDGGWRQAGRQAGRQAVSQSGRQAGLAPLSSFGANDRCLHLSAAATDHVRSTQRDPPAARTRDTAKNETKKKRRART